MASLSTPNFLNQEKYTNNDETNGKNSLISSIDSDYQPYSGQQAVDTDQNV